MPAPTPPDPRYCPLCGQANQCAMEVERSTGIAQPPCWCTSVNFDATTLARVPLQASGLACICQACALAGENTKP